MHDGFDEAFSAGRDHYAHRRYPEALRMFGVARDIAPDHPHVRYWLGCVRLRLNEPDEALREFETAAHFDPDLIEPYLAMAKVHKDRGNRVIFRELLEMASELPGGRATHALAVGHTHHERGDYEAALRPYRNAALCDPDNPAGAYATGAVCLKLKRYAEARDAFTTAAASPLAVAEVHYGLGVAEQRLGHLEAALAAYRAAVRVSPHYYHGYVALGALELRTGRWRSAWSDFRAAVRHSPFRNAPPPRKGSAGGTG